MIMSPTMKPSKRSTQDSKMESTTKKTSKGFTDEEREAMKERAKELKGGGEDVEKAVLAKIASMTGPDKAMAERIHSIVKASAPGLEPRLWYGMPAYSMDGKLICFFQPAQKFKTRYATLGFSDKAKLDDGAMWANAFALVRLGASEEARIVALLKKATS